MRMRFKLSTAVVAIALMTMAPSALAATQAGNQCVGNRSTEKATVFGTANAPGNPLPATIPVNGVITSWTFNIVSIPPGIISQTLKILRPTGAPSQFQVIGETAPGSLVGGSNTFSTRIPVHTGDLIGDVATAEGEQISIYCETGNAGDRVGVIAGNPPLNSTATSLGEQGGFQVPATVSVEPDADNDGYGDETQDQCPQSAAFQSACPTVALSTSTQVKKGAVTVIVTTNTPAPVSVKGVANLGKGKKATLKAATQNLSPGVLGKFKLKFSKQLKTKLKELSRKQSLTLKVTVTGTSVAGQATKKTLKVKLKGQG
jgi:hypothetical protein